MLICDECIFDYFMNHECVSIYWVSLLYVICRLSVNSVIFACFYLRTCNLLINVLLINRPNILFFINYPYDFYLNIIY